MSGLSWMTAEEVETELDAIESSESERRCPYTWPSIAELEWRSWLARAFETLRAYTANEEPRW